MNLRRFLPPALALALLATAALAGTVTIINNSKFDIHHMFLSPVDTDEWGPDQLGENVLEANGGRFQLRDVPCDTYDLMLVDEDGDECVVPEVDVCEAQKWEISNDDLLDCEGFEN